jgi:hypothetical protein
MPTIIQNAVKITEGKKITYLISTHRHDFVTYTFKNSKEYIGIDGGTGYLKRCNIKPDLSAPKPNYEYEDYSLYEDSNFQLEIIPKLLWGSRGKNGDEKLTYKPLMCLTRAHLKAILKTQERIKGTIYEKVIKHILENGYK